MDAHDLNGQNKSLKYSFHAECAIFVSSLCLSDKQHKSKRNET